MAKTKEIAYEHLEHLGWVIKSFNYDKPVSGFKCIEGGYTCEVQADESDYNNLASIRFDDNIVGTIEPFGFIQALYSKDFVKLIKKMPAKSVR